MVAFPSGPMGGGLPPTGGAAAQPSMTGGGSFGSMFASTGGINAFLEGPFQDLTEGLASVITKDNSYRAYINEKRSARKRGRLTNALQPLETISTMLAKEPRLAKVFGPGGAYDGMLQTQVALARASLAENGLPPELADQYTMVIDALSQAGEEPEMTAAQQNLRAWEENYNNGQPAPPDIARQFLGGGQTQDPNEKKIGEFQRPDGGMTFIMQRADGTYYSMDAGQARMPVPQVVQTFGVDPETGMFTTAGGGGGVAGGTTGAAAGGAGGAGPGGGPGIIPTGKPSYGDMQGINSRVAEMDTGVKIIDQMLGVTGQEGPQLGRAGGVIGFAKEFLRVGRDLASLAPAVREPINQLTKVADSMIQRDLNAGNIDPELASSLILGDATVDAKAAEARLAYMYARLLQGDGKILKDAVESARASVSLLKGSEQTVVQNLLNLRQAFVSSRQSLQKSSGLTVKPGQERPNLGEYEPKGTEQGKAAPKAKEDVPVVKNDADYEALPSGTRFIDPNGQERIKP
jgi:hypothetical protein